MPQPTRRISLLLVLLTLVLLQGCGFHLRGSADLPSSISPLLIQGVGKYDGLMVELTLMLTSNTVQITEERNAANAVLRIRDRESDRRVLSVDGTGKVVEYELHTKIRFDMIDATGTQLVPEQTVSVLRTYINPEEEVLGKEREEEMLSKEMMHQDMAVRVVRRLQALLH